MWLEGSERISPALSAGETVVYRGWMLRASKYTRLQTLVESAGARLLAPLEMYTRTHHLPEWYKWSGQRFETLDARGVHAGAHAFGSNQQHRVPETVKAVITLEG